MGKLSLYSNLTWKGWSGISYSNGVEMLSSHLTTTVCTDNIHKKAPESSNSHLWLPIDCDCGIILDILMVLMSTLFSSVEWDDNYKIFYFVSSSMILLLRIIPWRCRWSIDWCYCNKTSVSLEHPQRAQNERNFSITGSSSRMDGQRSVTSLLMCYTITQAVLLLLILLLLSLVRRLVAWNGAARSLSPTIPSWSLRKLPRQICEQKNKQYEYSVRRTSRAKQHSLNPELSKIL